jgi:hypothetical protein
MVAEVWATGMSMTPPIGVGVVHDVGPHEAVRVPAQPPWALQASPVVQARPSSQGIPAVTGVWEHPVPAAQASVVQGLLSSQLTAAPPVQAPAWQVCPVRHLLGAQAVPLLTGVCTQAPITTVSVVQAFMSSQLGVKHWACPETTWQAWFWATQGLGRQGLVVHPPMPSSW